MGLRNPFRMAFDPNAAGTRFYINDVGQHHWEEIDEGQCRGRLRMERAGRALSHRIGNGLWGAARRHDEPDICL